MLDKIKFFDFIELTSGRRENDRRNTQTSKMTMDFDNYHKENQQGAEINCRSEQDFRIMKKEPPYGSY